jgi:hypothetical protein
VDENLEVLIPKLSARDLSEDEIHCKQDYMLIAFLENRDRYDLRDFEVPSNQQKNSQPKLFLEPIINQISAITAIVCKPAASTQIQDEEEVKSDRTMTEIDSQIDDQEDRAEVTMIEEEGRRASAEVDDMEDRNSRFQKVQAALEEQCSFI